jgi:hypothetical protein
MTFSDIFHNVTGTYSGNNDIFVKDIKKIKYVHRLDHKNVSGNNQLDQKICQDPEIDQLDKEKI